MPKLASWIRPCDKEWFDPILATRPEIELWNASQQVGSLAEMDGLLLTGGNDVSPEFLGQPVPDPSILEEPDRPRDQWEFEAVAIALERGLPIFAICRGMQLLNVALGGTLFLDIPAHNLPEQKNNDVQPLCHDTTAAHQFEKVNSSHHQAVDRLGDGCVVESWCAEDGVIEQFRLRDRAFGLAVQYHPERGSIYGQLFADFLSRLS